MTEAMDCKGNCVMNKEWTANKNYLLLPIAVGGESKTVSFHAEGEKIYEFRIPIVMEAQERYSFHFFAPLPVKQWNGKRITVSGEFPVSFLSAIAESDSIPEMQESRPVVHFAANTGWINDPNGLVFQDGQYHMYFQYNPFDVNWDNMCWGHAVSKDLLHWTQLETVLYPDADGTMYSGSAVRNERGLLGLPENAQILFYTCAGNTSEWSKEKEFVQKIAYSLDGGKTFEKRTDTAVPNLAYKNRDPKVYWHEQSSAYYMVLYLSGNEYAILRSENLKEWSLSQRLELEGMLECPDLRPVPMEGGGEKWIFIGADGYYFTGDFDGYAFYPQGERREAYRNKIPYAAQTFWGCEKVILVPWLRLKNIGKSSTGAMGLPRCLSLTEKDSVYLLRQTPVPEWDSQKEMVCRKDGIRQAEIIQKREAASELSLKFSKACDFSVDLYGTVCDYLCGSGELRGKEFRIDFGKEIRQISFFSDGEILEIFGENGLLYAAVEADTDQKRGKITVYAEEEFSAAVYRVESIKI